MKIYNLYVVVVIALKVINYNIVTPEEKKLLEDTVRKLDLFLDIYYRTNFIDKTVFHNPVVFNNNIVIGKNGLKIGTSTSDKVGFFNAVPVDQPATVADPSGGVTIDSQSRTAIIAIIDRLQETGLIA